MRVTWLSLEWPRAGSHSGGVGRYVARMAQRVAELVDLTVVTFADAEKYPGIRYAKIPAPAGRLDRYYQSAWRARTAVASTLPDLVHAHGDDYLLAGEVPIVRTFYGLSLSEARSSTGLRRINHYVLAGLEQLAARRAAVRLGIAVETVDHFRCESLTPPFFGVTPVGARQPSDVPTIVFIGSFQGRKQGWLAQQAVARLRERGGWPDARLIAIGPRDDAANWEPWVDHRSGIDDDAVSLLMANAWLLVSPSIYEGFGIPVVEALAHDVAAVAVINPGSSYIHSQADTAVPLDLTDLDGFADAVATRIAKGPLLNAQEKDAANAVVSRLTHAGSPERLVEIYHDALRKA